jgi:hypothetical protein
MVIRIVAVLAFTAIVRRTALGSAELREWRAQQKHLTTWRAITADLDSHARLAFDWIRGRVAAPHRCQTTAGKTIDPASRHIGDP